MNWKRRKFHNYTQGGHSGSHAITWAAITISVCKVFPTTSNSERGICSSTLLDLSRNSLYGNWKDIIMCKEKDAF